MHRTVATLGALAIIVGASSAMADEQQAIDGCIDQMRVVGGPDARNGGEVLSSDYSEAGTMVMLQDAGGTVWKCLASNSGLVEELSIAEAMDDGGGAMAGSDDNSDYDIGATETVRVRFPPGSSGVDLVGRLRPGNSVRYVLGASNGQFLNIELLPEDPGLVYQIFNPDQSFLLDQMSARTPYRGQLWQSGDHVVEVYNNGHRNASYTIDFWID